MDCENRWLYPFFVSLDFHHGLIRQVQRDVPTTSPYISDENKGLRGDSLARISHHLTVEARHRPATTALRLLAVLNVLFKYASARRASRALY